MPSCSPTDRPVRKAFTLAQTRPSTSLVVSPASASALRAAAAMISFSVQPGASPQAARPTPAIATEPLMSLVFGIARVFLLFLGEFDDGRITVFGDARLDLHADLHRGRLESRHA